MKVFLKKESNNEKCLSIENIIFVENINDADTYNFNQFIFKESKIKKKTIFLDNSQNIYCFDISLLPERYKSYFLIGKINDENIWFRINYFFENLSWIALHSLSLKTKQVVLNQDFLKSLKIINIKDFVNVNNLGKNILIKNDILSPHNLVVWERLYKLYWNIKKTLLILEKKWLAWKIFFEDFILSLLPKKYWAQSLFFLNSNLDLKILKFFNTYEEIISLHIPVARSKYAKDMFEALLDQTNKRFKVCIWVDGYDKDHKDWIVAEIKKYKDKFDNFSYFVNSKNLWVGKTRRKLLNKDKTSRYVVFLDDDNFLSENTIDFLYKSIKKYPHMWIYSIENVDVRFDVDYKDYIFQKWPFFMPWVYTNRERKNRIPIYLNEEETPLVHDRYYSDLLDIKYNNYFNNCSVDLVFNRFLEILCWNINLKWAIQFMRIGHQYHQTREKWFEEKEFFYNMYILRKMLYWMNIKQRYSYSIKIEFPKQNDLFINEEK